MILVRTFSQEEILQIIAQFAAEHLPKESSGKIHLEWNDDDGVVVTFLSSQEEN